MGIENKRQHMRVRVTLPVEIYDVLNDRSFVGRITDISAGGVSMVTREELPLNTPVSLTFSIEDIKFKRIPADVVRETKKGAESYLGIAFFEPDTNQQSQLDHLVRRIHSRKERGLQKGSL